MTIHGATAGSPFPVFVNGILYRSLFAASEVAGVSHVWMTAAITKKGGAPVIIKKQVVVTVFWVRGRVEKMRVWA